MGRYVESSLVPGERVVYETRYQWIIFWRPKALLTLWIMPWIERISSEFAITDKRIIIKTGLLSRHTVELNVRQVESVNVQQSLVGRMLDYGSVTVVGSGGTREVLSYIAKPLEFRRAYQRQL